MAARKTGVRVEEVVYDGYRYRRYPDSPRGAHRRYFSRSGKLLHRAIWEREVGPIPPGWHVHHKNRDPGDNSIENLECLPGGQHWEEHADERSTNSSRPAQLAHLDRIRSKASDWHRSEAGIAWHREHAKESIVKPGHKRVYRVRGTRQCIWCGAMFEYRSEKALMCSSACNFQMSAYRRGKRREPHPHYAASMQSG
jgi:hypothetical protein